MATRKQIWQAAVSAVRDEVRKHREGQHAWTQVQPKNWGLSSDTWLLWALGIVERLNAAQVKPEIEIADNVLRGFLDKPLIELAEALRDA